MVQLSDDLLRSLEPDDVSPIRPSLCTDRITQLGPDRMRAVCDTLSHATDCS